MNNRFDLTSLVLQAISLLILFQDYNNTDLMNELHNQDEIYLKKIIEQNNAILDALKKGSD